jgi:uncharacterized protein (DUF169 family)
MDCARIAKTLSDGLGLARPPIGLAFLREPPEGIPRYQEAVPTACSFWKAAEKALFYATAEDHYNCPIGAITQGFQPPAEVMARGMELIGQMGKLRYFDATEIQNVPVVEKQHQVILYGPLKDFESVQPDLVMMICQPFQAMLFSEAARDIAWRGPGTEERAFGRPACAVIPRALKDFATSVSLGCMGARTFAGLNDSDLLVAIPAERLGEAEHRICTILKANAEMRTFYAEHKSHYAPVA